MMKTVEDAVALCERERDGFYLTAFVIQGWLAQLVVQATAEYAEKKDARDRAMQNGLAWRTFLELFGKVDDGELPHVYSSLLRFAGCENDPLARILRQASVPLGVEHDCSGDYVGPKTPKIARQSSESVTLVRRTVERWCDWIDAAIHFQTHEHWHAAPLCFDFDPDKRELAALGRIQRHWAQKSEESKAYWLWHHGEAAERFKDSPKWTVLGEAMASTADRAWPYPRVDALIISLWPLLKHHNWTYCDLLNVARDLIARNESSTKSHPSCQFSYPLQCEQEFATYCRNVLGLRKAGRGKTAKNGKPSGYEVALRICTASAVRESENLS